VSTATHYPLNLAAIETIVDNAGTNPIVAALCNGYVRSAAHQYADDLTGELSGSGYARAEIATPTLTADGEALVLSGTDPEFASFTGTFDCIVFLEDTGVAATSRLLAAFSIAPTTITADTYAVDLPSAGIIRWTPVASTAEAAAAVSVDATGFTGNLSGTDTDVQTALDTLDAMATGGGTGISPVFVYNSSGSTTANRYTSWSTLMADVATIDGPKIIQFEQNETITASGMPGGGWDLNGATLMGVNALAGHTVFITFSEGVKLVGWGSVAVSTGCILYSKSSTPVWEISDHASHEFRDSGAVMAETCEFIRCTEGVGDVVEFRFFNGSGFVRPDTWGPLFAGDGSYEALAANGSGDVALKDTAGSSALQDDTIRGAGTVYRLAYNGCKPASYPAATGDTQTNASDYRIDLLSVADRHAYDHSTSGLAATNVQDAIDEIVASGGGGGVSLGETSTTAYRGDRGKTAYDHSQTTTGNPHGTTPAEITGFDTAVRTSRLDQMAAAGADVAMGSHKITGLANGASSTDAAAFGQIPTASSSTPAAPGTAAAGSSTSWAKGDHVHPYQASVVGGQDEGTSVTSTTDTSLLDAAIFISGQSTGDTVVGWFTFSHTNTSGTGRTHSIKPKLGATTLGTLSYNCPSGATTSGVGFFVLRSEGASDHNFGAAVFTSNSGVSAFQTVTTENLSTGADLDLLGATGAGGSQTNTLQLTSITRHRA